MDPTKLFQTLADNGVLGVVLSISFIANYQLYKEIKSLQEKRVADAKEITATISKPLENIDQTMGAILALLKKA